MKKRKAALGHILDSFLMVGILSVGAVGLWLFARILEEPVIWRMKLTVMGFFFWWVYLIVRCSETYKRACKRIVCIVCMGAIGGMFFLESICGQESTISKAAFAKQIDIKTSEAVIGTNIRKHQEIYGDGKIIHRYKLKTDCPHWKYEDRYETEYALPYAIGDYAAVETEAVEITVSLNGTLLSEGQHFTVPSLGLVSDNISIEEYEKQLTADAYEQYIQNIHFENQVKRQTVYIVFAGMVVIVLGICYILYRRSNPKKVPVILKYEVDSGDGVFTCQVTEEDGPKMEKLLQANKSIRLIQKSAKKRKPFDGQSCGQS